MSNTLDELIGKLEWQPDSAAELLQDAERVQQILARQSKTPELNAVLKEAIAIYMERNGKTVLISDSNPGQARALKDRLAAEDFRVIECSDSVSLQKYFTDRQTGEFHLTGIIGGFEPKESIERHVFIQNQIFSNNEANCVWLTHRGRENNTLFSYDPPPILPDHKIINRIVNEVKLSDVAERSVTRVFPRREFLQDEFARTNDPNTLYDLAELDRKEGRWEQALDSYKQVLDANKYHPGAIIGYAGLLLRGKMRGTALKAEFQEKGKEGLVGLLSFLQDKKSNASVGSDVNHLLGKTLVLLYQETVKKPDCSDSEKQTCRDQILGEAIELLEGHREARSTKHDFDALGYLAWAYILEGSSASKLKAYDLIEFSIQHSDPISEGISPTSTFELDIAKMLQGVDVQGSRLMQLTGLNRVFEICEDLVAKKFVAPHNLARAQNEVRNHNDLAKYASELKIKVAGSEQQIMLPGEAYLISKTPIEELERAVTPEVVFEVMPLVRGRQMAKRFEVLEGIAEGPRSEVTKSVDEIKEAHLEWLVDADAKLQTVGTKYLGLNDVTKQKYKIHIGARSKSVGFYTKRIFMKLVDGEYRPASHGTEQQKPRVKLSRKRKQELKVFMETLEGRLQLAPEWLRLFYTDSNIRNYLLDYTGDTPNQHDDWIVHSSKGRVDLENRDKRLGIADPITAVEHELSEMKSERRVKIGEYLINRWLRGIIVDWLPEYWKSEACTGEQSKAYDEFKQKSEAVLDGETNGTRRDKLKDLLTTYLPRLERGFTLDKFREYHHIESLFRHMTIVGDKDGEIELVGRVINQMHGKYEQLKDYKPLKDFKDEYSRLQAEVQIDDKSKINLSYCYLRKVHQDLKNDKESHMSYVHQRLDGLKQRKLKKFLATNFGWK